MKTLKDLFLTNLADIYDAEQQFVHALARMEETVTCAHLKKSILKHLRETEAHVTKVEQVFIAFSEKPRTRRCQVLAGLLHETDAIAAVFRDSLTINAALICIAQKIEHYEIASYGCLSEWASMLGNQEAANLLKEILEEEKEANEEFTDLAISHGNPEAMGITNSVHGSDVTARESLAMDYSNATDE